MCYPIIFWQNLLSKTAFPLSNIILYNKTPQSEWAVVGYLVFKKGFIEELYTTMTKRYLMEGCTSPG